MDATVPNKPALGEIAASDSATSAELAQAVDDLLRARGGDVEIYTRVWQHPQVKSCFEQRRSGVIAREWFVEPGGEEARDVQAADDLRAQLHSIQWDDICRKMLFGVFLGNSYAECLFAVDAGHVRLSDIRVRKAKRFRFGNDGSLRLLTADDPKGRLLPDAKFWTCRWGAEDDDSPYGLGLAWWLYWPTWFGRGGERFWALHLEKFASPTPLAKVPPGLGEEEMKKVLALLKAIQSGGRLVVPKHVELELLAAATGDGGYLPFLQRIDAQVSKIILTQTMTSDDGASLAQAKVHGDKGDDVSKGDSDILCASFNTQVARWLTHWNFPGAAVPRVWRKHEEAVDTEAEARRDQLIYQLGYRPTAERILEVYGEGYEAVPASASLPGAVAFAEPAVPTADTIAQGAAEEWRELLGPEVGNIEKLAAECTSLEQLRDRLGELALSNPDPLVEHLARRLFFATSTGEVGGELDGDD